MKMFCCFVCLLLALVVFSTVTGIGTCASYDVFGVSCPACGLTRAWLAALGGHVVVAFALHPLFLLVLLAPVPLCRLQGKRFTRNQANNWWLVLLAVFMVVWVVRMALYFPATYPVNVNEDALLFKLLKM